MSSTENFIAEGNEEETVEIHNSGLIICAVFLPQLFERLSLVTDGGFTNNESRNRAVYILQQLVFNENDFPEDELLLNKLLVGMQAEQPLVPIGELSANEIEQSENLINGLINNWEKMKNTSPEGLQETFIRRYGMLKFKSDKVLLVVEKKGYDILLQAIPWNISIIKLPWMKRPIHVDWI